MTRKEVLSGRVDRKKEIARLYTEEGKPIVDILVEVPSASYHLYSPLMFTYFSDSGIYEEFCSDIKKFQQDPEAQRQYRLKSLQARNPTAIETIIELNALGLNCSVISKRLKIPINPAQINQYLHDLNIQCNGTSSPLPEMHIGDIVPRVIHRDRLVTYDEKEQNLLISIREIPKDLVLETKPYYSWINAYKEKFEKYRYIFDDLAKILSIIEKTTYPNKESNHGKQNEAMGYFLKFIDNCHPEDNNLISRSIEKIMDTENQKKKNNKGKIDFFQAKAKIYEMMLVIC